MWDNLLLMNPKEGNSIPEDENQRSIRILQYLQSYDWFSQDPEDRTRVRLYHRNNEGLLSPAQESFSVADVLTAVDFYQKNRDHDLFVSNAMQKPDGVVRVWTGPSNKRRVAVSIRNSLVPQILEFAYLLARDTRRGTSERSYDSTKEKRLAEMLSDWQVRPNPRQILDLVINQDLSAEDILSAGEAQGYPRPKMDVTIDEFQNAIPFILQATKLLAKQYPDVRIYFLGRDSESLYDAYRLTQPDNEAVLFPGGMAFWEDHAMEKGKRAARYFNESGLTPKILRAAQPGALLLDTGFGGRVGFFIRRALSRLYRLDEEGMRQRLPMKLISNIYFRTVSHGAQLMEFKTDDEIFSKDLFPKVSSVIGEPLQRNETSRYSYDRFAYRLAMSLQLLPHFHDVYSTLIERNGKLMAAPADKVPVRDDVDTISKDDEGEGRNASIVNPVASLVIQHALVLNLLSSGRVK